MVIGCFSPDFDYFVRLAPQGHFGHTLPGFFLSDLPASLLVLWLYLRLLEPAVNAWFPRSSTAASGGDPLKARFSSIRGFTLACISILIGAATHVLWDAFTHREYWPYQHLPLLRYSVHLSPLPGIRIFKLLQYGSTAVVAAVLLVILFRHGQAVSEYVSHIQPPSRRLLRDGIILALAGAYVRALVGAGIPRTRHSAKLFLIEGVVTTITLLWLEALIFQNRLRRAAPGYEAADR